MFDFVLFPSNASVPFVELNIRILLLFAVVFVLTRLLQRAPAALRYSLWLAAFMAVIVLPLAATLTPQWHANVIPLPSSSRQNISYDVTATPQKPLVSETESNTTAAEVIPENKTAVLTPQSPTTQVTTSPHQSYKLPVWLLAWAAGFAFFVFKIVFGVSNIRKIIQRSQELADDDFLKMLVDEKRRLDIRTFLEVYRSNEITSPLATGWIRPVILLPESFDTLSAQKKRYIVLHELAHVKRQDMLWQAVVQLITAALWFNPMVWFAAQRCTLEREHACDELVLHFGEQPSGYANLLLEFAQTRHSRLAHAGISMARRSQLEGRLLSILSHNSTKNPLSRTLLLKASGVVACLVFLLATFTPFSAAHVNTGLVDPPHENLILESLSIAIYDNDDDVREQAINTLGKIKSDRATQLLYTALRSRDFDDQVRAAKLLIKRGETKAWQPFVNDLQHDDPEKRIRAARLLRDIKHPATLKPLVRAMDDHNSEVREHVVRAIAELRISNAIKPLASALKDEDTDVREIAAWGLGEMKDPAALPILYSALNDPEAEVRRAAIESIGDLRDPASAVYLHKMIHDRNSGVRRETVEVLEEIRAAESVPYLIEALRDEHYKVRKAAAEALGEFRDSRAIVPLSAALHDKSDNVREEAANALGEFYNEE